MFKTFVVSGKFNRKDIIASFLLGFLHRRIGFISLLLSLFILMLWALASFGYAHVLIILIIVSFLPWLYKAAYLLVNTLGNARLGFKKIEFNSKYVKLFNYDKDFKMSIIIPREIIKEIKYIRNYVYIVTKYNDGMAMNTKILSEQEMIMVKGYLKDSLLSSENADDKYKDAKKIIESSKKK